VCDAHRARLGRVVASCAAVGIFLVAGWAGELIMAAFYQEKK
jgi:hypothetical protein